MLKIRARVFTLNKSQYLFIRVFFVIFILINNSNVILYKI